MSTRSGDAGKGWRLQITVLPGRYVLARLRPDESVPTWALRGPFGSIMRTESELAILCPERDVPPGVDRQGTWRALRLAGHLNHMREAGVLLTAAEPLARAGIPVYPATATESGFLFVRVEDFSRALETLASWGHSVREIDT